MVTKSLFFCHRLRTNLHLSLPFTFDIRFLLQNNTIWIKRKIYDNISSLLSLTMDENFKVAEDRSPMWELYASKYKVYGLPDSPTDICTPLYSSSCTLNTPLVIKVKIEHVIHTVIYFLVSSNDDVPPLPTFCKPSLPFLIFPFCPPFIYAVNHYVVLLHPFPSHAYPLLNVYVFQLLCLIGKNPQEVRFWHFANHGGEFSFALLWWSSNVCPPRWFLILSYEAQVHGRHGQTL